MRLLLVLLAALVTATPAAAQTSVLDQASEALGADPVYVHPGTDALTDAEADELRGAIEERGAAPLFVAILPPSARGEAGGSSTNVALQLGERLGRQGVYAVVVGDQFRAVSNDLARDQAPALATRAFLTNNEEGVAAVLMDFASRVGDVRAGSAESAGNESGGGFPSWLLVVGGAIAALLGFRALRRRRRRERELAEVKAVAREDLVALADDVVGLDEEVEAHPEAKAAYLRAMEAYQRADDAFDRARSPEDIARVTTALVDSRHQMDAAKAHLAGKPLPEARPPCFFDPRHGTSVEDVTWTSPYGGPMNGAGLRGRRPAGERRRGARRPPDHGQRPAETVLGRARLLPALGVRVLRPRRGRAPRRVRLRPGGGGRWVQRSRRRRLRRR